MPPFFLGGFVLFYGREEGDLSSRRHVFLRLSVVNRIRRVLPACLALGEGEGEGKGSECGNCRRTGLACRHYKCLHVRVRACVRVSVRARVRAYAHVRSYVRECGRVCVRAVIPYMACECVRTHSNQGSYLGGGSPTLPLPPLLPLLFLLLFRRLLLLFRLFFVLLVLRCMHVGGWI